MKKLLKIEINSGLKRLNDSQMFKISGGLVEAAASGKTRTASGSTCDNTAVCNCICPKKPKELSFE
ncbi:MULTISPECIES: hypothetical protein [Flavobacterium]|uniref:Natural product n=1 Tax=Flavobacterium jumunjinense TaxID=998845 RepID=A0ABV5GM44_9FLAO|nr:MULTISPECIES: hypothetical protein [Flavobacterium]